MKSELVIFRPKLLLMKPWLLGDFENVGDFFFDFPTIKKLFELWGHFGADFRKQTSTFFKQSLGAQVFEPKFGGR